MRLQVDLSLLLRSDFPTGRIIGVVEQRTAPKSTFGFGRANELHHRLVADQRLPGPILTDQTKHAMLSRIPLGSPGWQMRDRDLQVILISQLLQAKLPQPTAVPISTLSCSCCLKHSPLSLGYGITDQYSYKDVWRNLR